MRTGCHEVLVQLVDVLDHPVLAGRRRSRCSRSATGAGRTPRGRPRRRAGTPGCSKLRGQQQHGEHLVDAAQTAGVDLADAQPPACMNCLNMMRFWQCSPVAIRIGATSRAMRAWPRMSSGLVGSSIHQGSNSASRRVARDRLVDVPHLVGVHHQEALGADLLADQRGAADVVVGVARRPSSSSASSPAATAARQRRRTSSSVKPSQPTEVV